MCIGISVYGSLVRLWRFMRAYAKKRKQKNSVYDVSDTPRMIVLTIFRPNLRSHLGIKNIFSVNSTYSYSFLG